MTSLMKQYGKIDTEFSLVENQTKNVILKSGYVRKIFDINIFFLNNKIY